MEFRVYIIYSEKKKTTPPKKTQQNKNQRTLRRDLVLSGTYILTLLMSFDMIARESYSRKFFGTSLPIF